MTLTSLTPSGFPSAPEGRTIRPMPAPRYAMQIVGLADGVTASPFDGKYVSRYEPDKWRLEEISSLDEMWTKVAGWLSVVDDPRDALLFDNPIDASNLWRQPLDSIRPWDGKPNRPLTAFTISVAKVPE